MKTKNINKHVKTTETAILNLKNVRIYKYKNIRNGIV